MVDSSMLKDFRFYVQGDNYVLGHFKIIIINQWLLPQKNYLVK